MPARFFIFVYKTCCRSNSVSQCICDWVAALNIFAVCILSKRKYRVADPSGNIFIGNINPHTKLCGICKSFFIACILKRRHHISGFERVSVVNIKCHCAVSAVNFAVFRVNGIYFSFGQYIVICRVAEFEHTCIAVFKIKDNIRSLAESDF